MPYIISYLDGLRIGRFRDYSKRRTVLIINKQQNTTWGSNFIGQLSKDLRNAFTETSGFSKRNLELVRQWSLFYSTCFAGIAKQLVSQMENGKSEIRFARRNS